MSPGSACNEHACLLSVLITVLILSVELPGDEIVKQDGDVLDGIILERSDRELLVRFSTGEEQTVPRSEVEYFTIEQTKVTLKGGDSLTGRKLDDQEETVVLEVDPGARVIVQKSNIKDIEKVKKRFSGATPGKELPLKGPMFLSGGFNLGYSLTRGTSGVERFYVRGRLRYDRKLINNESSARYSYGRSEQVTTTDEGEIENNLNYSVSKHAFLYNDVLAGYDNIQQIDLFLETSAGIGAELLVNSPPKLTFRTGPSYRTEKRDGADDRNEVSGLVAETFRTQLNDRVTFQQEYKFIPSLTNSGEYRQKVSSELDVDLGKSWSLTLYGEQSYDSNPVPGTDKEETQVNSTLGYSF